MTAPPEAWVSPPWACAVLDLRPAPRDPLPAVLPPPVHTDRDRTAGWSLRGYHPDRTAIVVTLTGLDGTTTGVALPLSGPLFEARPTLLGLAALLPRKVTTRPVRERPMRPQRSWALVPALHRALRDHLVPVDPDNPTLGLQYATLGAVGHAAIGRLRPYGITPESLTSWVARGWEPEDVPAWHTALYDRPCHKGWRHTDLTPEQVRRLIDAKVYQPSLYLAWSEAGFDLPTICAWAFTSPAVAREWIDAGIDVTDGRAWSDLVTQGSLDSPDVLAAHQAGLSHLDARTLLGAIADAAGVDYVPVGAGQDLRGWARVHQHPQRPTPLPQVLTCIAAGLTPDEAYTTLNETGLDLAALRTLAALRP